MQGVSFFFQPERKKSRERQVKRAVQSNIKKYQFVVSGIIHGNDLAYFFFIFHYMESNEDVTGDLKINPQGNQYSNR